MGLEQHRRFILIICAYVLFPLSSATAQNPGMAGNSDQGMDLITAANTDFAVKLYKVLSIQDGDENVFFSPLSVSVALAMTCVGARGNTETQILAALGISSDSKDHLHASFNKVIPSLTETGTAEIANKIFVQNGFDVIPSFHETLQTMYNTSCTSLNFDDSSATRVVNDWVKKETNGKINKLVERLTSDTVMIIANAVYFKSLWANQFSPRRTRVLPFHINDKETISINLMIQTSKFRLAFHEASNTDVLELDHKNGQTSMLIFLPREIDGLPQLESTFGKELLNEALARMSLIKTDVWLPAFKLEESYSLKDALTNLGISDLFSVLNANLKGISEKDDLYASQVVHKSYIEVNEEGTEAAAATAVMINKRSLQINASFRADHPFMFCIVQKKTNALLFLGKLAKPQPVDVPHEEL